MKRAMIKVIIFSLCAVLLLSHQCVSFADLYTFTTSSGRWTTTCDLEEAVGFGSEIYQYQYKQQTKKAQTLQDSLSSALQSLVTFTTNVDNSAHLFDGCFHFCAHVCFG